MTELGGASSGASTDYHRIYNPTNLLLRYAKGRIRHFAYRQIFAVANGIILWFLVSPGVGLLAMTLVFLGDVADCILLRYIPIMFARGHSFYKLSILTGVTAGIQALTAAVCVWLSWYAQHDDAEPLFALGLLISATINAGMVLPYNPVAGYVRLTVYGLTPMAILAGEVFGTFESDDHIHMNLAGLAMLYMMMMWMQNFMNGNFHRTRLHLKDQFEQRQQLEVSNALLQEQQEQARRLALVAEHAYDSVFLIDREDKISWVNDSFTRITGYTYSEAVGRTPCELLGTKDPDSEEASLLLGNRAKGLPFQIEIQSRRKDGSLIWIETNQVPVRGYNGEIETVVAVERDVTAAHLHAQEMEEARIAAEEGERTKAEFLATMSHEIRTPMNGVIGMAQMLEGTSLDAEQQLYTGTILSSSKTLLALINDVLDLSKLDANKVSFSSVDFDIHESFEETLRLLQPQAWGKGLTLALDISETAPKNVHGDDRRIRQILLNLVGNAIKFTDTGEVRVTLKIKPQGDALALSFSVKDTGIGIPENKLDRIFEHFSQAEAATTRRYGGTGLGLAISRKLTNAMGGEITVTSDVGVGTCLTVTLELEAAKTVGDSGEDTKVAKVLIPSVPSGMRILVAEDNKVNRLVMKKFLRDVPIELEFAHNGSEAVEKVQENRPHLVFMDMSMPVMSGLDATRVIRNSGGAQPVIVALTANAFESDRKACLQAGMDEFLSKPLNRNDLLAVLQRYGEADNPRS
ncbi:response regulator [Parasedimentitalea marina]|uniref:Sensory/regulatory protein RpfC n=1 Tax=Parasedimentitalea marina TaxID=2483033 RepID=A0A3T0MXG1_9RHOB|nr:ATP-binding protein [Parasedimentitalea marina]AZV76438.1 response regulator [Parasedimentitalea marina]